MVAKNVREPWEMHDTLCVCQALYGSESNAGYFTTFNAFGQQLEHLFFKRRSEGNVHRAYNNQQAEDRADFVFHAFQVGLAFIAPPTPLDVDGAAPANPNEFLNVWWQTDLPRHCSASLKIGQDTNLVLNAMMMSPGYGPSNSGVSYGVDDTNVGVNWQEMVHTASQGIPTPQARYWIAGGTLANPKPIGIPKGELVELRLEVSEHARGLLQATTGPGSIRMGGTGEGPGGSGSYIVSRYAIQASLWGFREVQQRGELRAS